MHKLPFVLARVAALPVTIALFATGCSGGGSNKAGSTSASHTIQSVAAATRAAGSGSAHGTALGAQGQKGPFQSSWVTPADPKAQDNGRATFAMFLGSKPTGIVELRWIGSVMYIGRVARPRSTVRLVGLQSLLLRAGADREFLPASMTYLSVLAAAFSPSRLSAWMASTSANVRSRPGETSNGSKTKEYYTTKPLPAIGPWPQASVSIWADSHDRVVRARITTPAGGVDYTVDGYSSQPAVNPPPPSKVVTPTTLPPPTAAGAYAQAASGQTGPVAWSLLRAPGTRGTECWRWSATPPAPVFDAKADGSRCYLAQQPGDSLADATAVVVRTKPRGRYSAIAVRLPKALTKATIGFTGGKLQSVEPTGNYLVWVGPASPLPAYLGLTYANGTKVDCFAGTLLYVSDLESASDSEVAGGDWSCS